MYAKDVRDIKHARVNLSEQRNQLWHDKGVALLRSSWCYDSIDTVEG